MGVEASLHHERQGAGPPLVLLHALGGSLRSWDPVMGLLVAQRDVIAVDLPGFGRSPALPADVRPTPAALAAAVAQTLDAIGVQRPHVAGNSLGAWVALELARTGSARSVTAIAPAGFWRGPLAPRGRVNAQSLSRVLRPVLIGALRLPAVRRGLLSGVVAHPERLTRADAARFVSDYARATGYADVNREMRGSQFTGADEITVPVTVAWCEFDRLVPPRKVPGLRAHALTLRGCGHVPMTDDPDAVARVLLHGSDDAEPRDDQRVSSSSSTIGET
jgi:pimeloyl-ACP methyl ester carboxylesterase